MVSPQKVEQDNEQEQSRLQMWVGESAADSQPVNAAEDSQLVCEVQFLHEFRDLPNYLSVNGLWLAWSFHGFTCAFLISNAQKYTTIYTSYLE